MSQRAIITNITGFGLTNEITSVTSITEDVLQFCIATEVLQEGDDYIVDYDWAWLEFGRPDNCGSIGESDSDCFIPDADIFNKCQEINAKFDGVEPEISEFTEWLESLGYTVEWIETGSGNVEMDE